MPTEATVLVLHRTVTRFVSLFSIISLIVQTGGRLASQELEETKIRLTQLSLAKLGLRLSLSIHNVFTDSFILLILM